MMLIGGSVMFLILVVLIIFILTSCIRIVPQAQALVVERLGGYLGTYGVGIHFMVPFIDRVAKKVNLKEQVEDFPPQPVITKDNVTMQIDTVVFFYITDPKSYAYGVERPILAIENLTATTLRNIIGELELDETLTSRETINAKMQESLDIAEKEAAILRAEAEKEKKIKEAEGQAEAIRAVQRATADGIRYIKEAGADQAVLQLKSLEAFQAAADGKANKIIIPSDIQGIAGLVKSISEIAAKEDTK